MVALVRDLLARLCILILVLLHLLLDLLRAELCFKLSNHDHVLRVGWIILSFWEAFQSISMSGVLHNDSFAEVKSGGSFQKARPLGVCQVKVVIGSSCNLD